MTPTIKELIAPTFIFAAVLSSVIFIGNFDEKTQAPEPITVDGQTINFTWTDNNDNENLHIYTDQATYSNGLSHATVYMAVVNKGEAQDVELAGFFRDSKKTIEDISVLKTVTKELNTPTYDTICTPIPKGVKTATSTEMPLVPTENCVSTQTGTTTEVASVLTWEKNSLVERKAAEMNKEVAWLSKGGVIQTMKSVEDFIADTKSTALRIENNEVLYFKVDIKFPANSADGFYFEAYGSEGGYGHLY